ncbi:hypothetical protein PVAP13_4KG175300 [Panicum virgatum]|uniref:CN hydrolase domain-containing protein n=1 Tax=Panicum virgatum TaxID=38727 RepID=A0A8T0TMI5_PANVG|nr:hypothetical protein PVAP13_4KG175300 [Panicum virgatum]
MSDKLFSLTLLSAQLVNSPSLPFVPLQKFRSPIALPPSRIIDLTMAQTSVSPPPLRPSKANTHKYKVALCQLLVSPDREENIARARSRIEAAADAGAMLIVMPEIWSCPYSLEILASYAEDIDGGVSPSISMLSEVAAARKITIVGGSIPEKASGKVFNTCCVIGPDGQILAKHRKLFVATCSPARDPNAESDYMIWGHSSLIGPFGEVLAAAGHEEATVIGEIDLSMILSTRENLPLGMQRRRDLYRWVDVQRRGESASDGARGVEGEDALVSDTVL